MSSTPYSCHILIKLEFFSTSFRKILVCSVMKTRPVRAELFHAGRRTDGQTDRHDEASSRDFKHPPRSI